MCKGQHRNWEKVCAQSMLVSFLQEMSESSMEWRKAVMPFRKTWPRLFKIKNFRVSILQILQQHIYFFLKNQSGHKLEQSCQQEQFLGKRHESVGETAPSWETRNLSFRQMFAYKSWSIWFTYCLTLKKVKVKLLGHAQHFATPWTVAHQAPPSMEFSR